MHYLLIPYLFSTLGVSVTITYIGFTKWMEIVRHLDTVKVTETWDRRSIFLAEFVFDLKGLKLQHIAISHWDRQQHSTLESLPSVSTHSWSKDHNGNLNLILSRAKLTRAH